MSPETVSQDKSSEIVSPETVSPETMSQDKSSETMSPETVSPETVSWQIFPPLHYFLPVICQNNEKSD